MLASLKFRLLVTAARRSVSVAALSLAAASAIMFKRNLCAELAAASAAASSAAASAVEPKANPQTVKRRKQELLELFAEAACIHTREARVAEQSKTSWGADE